MTTGGQKSLPAIGFLTIVRDAEHGHFGGYLVLNCVGRPLEFHCTAPVRPNRAQEILYGPTLEPYLFGERIGPALMQKTKSQPVVVFTDVAPAMAAREFVSTAMMLIVPASSVAKVTDHSATRSRYLRLDAAHHTPRSGSGRLHHFSLGPYQLAVDQLHRDDETILIGCWPEIAGRLDLDEPFGRIREAIDEARKGVS
jgi:hypothetical protein